MERAVGHFWVQIRDDVKFPVGWYFDTPWEYFEGPFNTLDEARKSFEAFCKEELGTDRI